MWGVVREGLDDMTVGRMFKEPANSPPQAHNTTTRRRSKTSWTGEICFDGRPVISMRSWCHDGKASLRADLIATHHILACEGAGLGPPTRGRAPLIGPRFHSALWSQAPNLACSILLLGVAERSAVANML
jgi:hypothetical protein